MMKSLEVFSIPKEMGNPMDRMTIFYDKVLISVSMRVVVTVMSFAMKVGPMQKQAGMFICADMVKAKSLAVLTEGYSTCRNPGSMLLWPRKLMLETGVGISEYAPLWLEYGVDAFDGCNGAESIIEVVVGDGSDELGRGHCLAEDIVLHVAWSAPLLKSLMMADVWRLVWELRYAWRAEVAAM